MKKMFFTGLAPLLVIAACAMAPASALGVGAEIVWPTCTPPACPHAYTNGVIKKEKALIRGIAWGTLKLHNEKLGDVECHNIFAGVGENPTGGGRAVGQVQAFYPYECVDETCKTNLGEIKVTAANFEGKISLPWRAEAEEQPAGTFYGKAGFKGLTENTRPTEAGFIEFNANCTTIAHPDFFGVNYLHTLNNGISIGSGPAESEGVHESVDPAHMRSLETVANSGGVGEVEKGTGAANLKGEGYGQEELFEVKNP
jgi:hypothetical protein